MTQQELDQMIADVQAGKFDSLTKALSDGSVSWDGLSKEVQQMLRDQFPPTEVNAWAVGKPLGGQQGDQGATPEGLTPEQIAAIIGGASAPGATTLTPQQQAYQASLAGLYQKLWGEPMPDKAFQSAADSGKNLFQLEEEWRNDPAFQKTQTWRDEDAGRAQDAAVLLGLRK